MIWKHVISIALYRSILVSIIISEGRWNNGLSSKLETLEREYSKGFWCSNSELGSGSSMRTRQKQMISVLQNEKDKAGEKHLFLPGS